MVKLQFISLIVPIPNLQKSFAAQGGFKYFKETYGAETEMVWHDDYVCRADGAMNDLDADAMVSRCESWGLIGLVDSASGKRWQDFCIAVSLGGPTYPCDWLEYDATNNAVYLHGKPKGPIRGGRTYMIEQMSVDVRCPNCQRNVTAEALQALRESPIADCSPESIPMNEFLRSYVCFGCRWPI